MAEKKKEVVLRGIGVSPGVVVGSVYVLASKSTIVPEWDVPVSRVDAEFARFEDAIIETRRQISKIQKNLMESTTGRDAELFDAHLMILDDRTFLEDVIEGITERRKNAEIVVKDVLGKHIDTLSTVDDDYLRERVADLRDVSRRIISNLSGDSVSQLGKLNKRHIVVAADLAPSETAALRKDLVVGFATDQGSPTSHTALMARALEIPAIVGLHDVTRTVRSGDEILIDGNKGVLIINPKPNQLKKYGELAKARKTIERELTTLKEEPAETLDGHRIVLSANVEGSEEVDAVLQYGAEGVGLFRSEYLYMSQEKVVGEMEQAEVYTEVAERLSPAPLIVRTFDIGGDKSIFGEQSMEANPFLGCRSIRLALARPDEFKVQLRAILRASAVGNVKIMYPMICNVEEVISANDLLEEAKAELKASKVAFDDDIEVGIMVEIPSAALTADVIAEHVSFFSLGTNDLVQYTLAVDRVNEKVAYLYEPTHPAVLKLIKLTVDAGHKHGLWIGLCGEIASDPIIAPLLIGMGIDELSVPPSAVPLIKDAVRSVTLSQAKKLAEKSLKASEAAEVLGYCRRLTKEVAPELLELI